MQKLQCELCGSVDMLRTDDGFFQCQHCGCKYTLEQAKALMGTVETTIGKAECERLLSNAETCYDLEQYTEAEKTYAEVTKQFPNDYRGWLGLLQLKYIRCKFSINGGMVLDGKSAAELKKLFDILKKLCASKEILDKVNREWDEFWDYFVKQCESGKLENADDDNFEVSTDYRYGLGCLQIWYRSCISGTETPGVETTKKRQNQFNISKKLCTSEKAVSRITKEWQSFWDCMASQCRSGKRLYCGGCNPEVFKDTSPAMYELSKAGFKNAKILNSMGVYYGRKSGEDYEEAWYPNKDEMGCYVYCLGRCAQYDRQNGRNSNYAIYWWPACYISKANLPVLDDGYIAKIKAEVQQYIKHQIKYDWCPYCDGRLKKNLFGKKCQNCGRKF